MQFGCLSAWFGVNHGSLTRTALTVCDREADGRRVLIELRAFNELGGFVYELRANGGPGTCASVDYTPHASIRYRIKVCEFVPRAGVTGCGLSVAFPRPA